MIEFTNVNFATKDSPEQMNVNVTREFIQTPGHSVSYKDFFIEDLIFSCQTIASFN